MAALDARQLASFEQDGYLIVENVLSEEELTGLEVEYREVLDQAVDALIEQGARSRPGDTFSERYIEALQQVDEVYALYQYLDISLPLLERLDSSHTMNAGPEVFRLLTNPRLLDLVESIIGPEIYSNPVQHTRIKPPVHRLPKTALDSNIAATMWHQDSAVITQEADATDMLTVWLAVTDATIQNGCLIAERGSHRGGELSLHCSGKGVAAEIYIPESIIDGDRVVPLEVGAGGAVFLHKMTEHGSLDNRSDDIRWSFDLRYQPIGQPTGRSVFPGFVARSAAHPDQVLTDYGEWARLWWEARDRIVLGEELLHLNSRWDANAAQPICA